MNAKATYSNNAMNHLWSYLRGLPMSSRDQLWLADRLIEASKAERPVKRKVDFPKLPEDFIPSAEVLAISCGPLPEGFDVDKELTNMWEEWAK